jgi:orotate phosphoribosyltransferase
VALADRFGRDVPLAYNRKEAKDHGEGGVIVGGPLAGRVLVVDDVITAGTAINEAITMIEDAGARLAGVVIGLDRCERGSGRASAVQELSGRHGVPVLAIVELADLIDYLRADGGAPEGTLEALLAYRERYGA